MSNMKNGAPIIAVKIETGISAAETLRATVSTAIINTAPILTDAGINAIWLLPNFMRHICGIRRPTQPTCPHMDTQEAVIAVAHKTVTPRRALMLTPDERASSSVRGKRFNFHRKSHRIIIPTIIGGAPNISVLYDALSSPPMSQYVIAGS